MPIKTSTPGSEIKGADIDANFAICVLTEADQTIAGKKTFSTPVAVSTPVDASDAATKYYVDNVFKTTSTPTRIKDVGYQNITGKTILAIVEIAISSGTGVGGGAGMIAYIGTSSPATIEIGKCYLYPNAGDNSGQSGTMTLIMVVPNNYYYRLASTIATGSITINYWTEFET
jgi:hypothetical protein